MTEDRIPITRQGYEKLKGDLSRLESEMMEVTKRVAAARDLGDLSENAEYHAAREDQGMKQAQINLVKDKLSRADYRSILSAQRHRCLRISREGPRSRFR